MQNFIFKLKRLKSLTFKTIYFNFHYFPFKTALNFPVFVHKKTKLIALKGQIHLPKNIYPGMIMIGYENTGIHKSKVSPLFWENYGIISFKGTANIGSGCKISVKEKLSFGDKFTTTAESTFIAFKHIEFGTNCLVSWNCTFIDTNFHEIYYQENVSSPICNEIIIGDNNWFGFDCTVLKGVIIKSNNVVAAKSLLNKPLNCSNSLIAGNPAVVIKKINKWER